MKPENMFLIHLAFSLSPLLVYFGAWIGVFVILAIYGNKGASE